MGGNITVLAATSGAPGMPTTGAGADGLWVAGAVAGGLSLLLAGVALRRRQAGHRGLAATRERACLRQSRRQALFLCAGGRAIG